MHPQCRGGSNPRRQRSCCRAMPNMMAGGHETAEHLTFAMMLGLPAIRSQGFSGDVGKIAMRVEPDGLPASLEPSRGPRSRRVRNARRAVVVAPIALAACQPAVLDPQGLVGIAEQTILID